MQDHFCFLSPTMWMQLQPRILPCRAQQSSGCGPLPQPSILCHLPGDGCLCHLRQDHLGAAEWQNPHSQVHVHHEVLHWWKPAQRILPMLDVWSKRLSRTTLDTTALQSLFFLTEAKKPQEVILRKCVTLTLVPMSVTSGSSQMRRYLLTTGQSSVDCHGSGAYLLGV